MINRVDVVIEVLLVAFRNWLESESNKKPLVYLSKLHKKTLSFLKGLVVDNSTEISNISLTPRDLINTHQLMTLVMKN